ncbi:hypothetical protein DLAC_08445 [Tieghemostelium lacteum]|uniref:Aminotransferase class I/classII large domain-containing protein n=1 Tax=Tieghemostelium lacteum TaxID=361077 RepID=A0A151ZC08_TIELA|nr:hypothetical protein DLAC_08445 [Tieghemostelium lacteum]|eukprot:KYQ91478.1 hypothetical protein DLAC_08445 [Tieghemostelium lacteum]
MTIDYNKFISNRGKLKGPSAIREIIAISQQPGMISLGGGLPNPSTFPFKSIKVELKDSSSLTIEGQDLELALQYLPTYGLPKLSLWLKELQKVKHYLTDRESWNLIITTGSQDALSMAMEVLLNDGDSIITEEPTYSGTLSILRPLALNIIGIETDEYGMKPDQLEQRLSTHPSDKPFPKVIYLIPTGQNPGGSTMNDKRKEEIYAIASKFNLLILEDDPYFYLQYGEEKSKKSFLSMDVDRRVIRFDSLSKILSSGLRIGFATGPQFLIEKIQYHQQSSTLHASGMSQVIAQQLLTSWGIENFDKHIESVQQFYKEKRDQFVAALLEHLGDLVEYNIPQAGMFFWMKLKGISDSKKLISQKALEKKVILLPGCAFLTNPSEISSHVRASFSIASSEQMNEALKRLSLLLKEEISN